MRRIHFSHIILLIVLVFALVLPAAKAQASSSVSASDLISLVNSIRTGNGLPALSANSILMGTAQSTAATMASYGSCSHIGNVRGRVADAGYGGGSTVWATENIACGYTASLGDIQSWWSDSAHMLPMTQPSYTDIGAGVYESGGMTYFVVHAAYSTGGSTAGRDTNSDSSSSLTGTTGGMTGENSVSQYIYGVITSTPKADGSVNHTVEYGQALSSIAEAYGVTVEELQTLNGLSGINIYVGDVLIIRKAPTPTVSPTRTATLQRPTRTPTVTPRPRTPTPTRTVTPTPVPGMLDSIASVDRATLGFGLVIVSATGLVTMISLSLFKKKPKQ